MARNPTWTRDELILALDLYFRMNPLQSSDTHPDIIALSRLLNELPIHADRPDQERFRNPNSVHMKLWNFLRLDPSYPGSGLDAGSKLEEVLWTEFSGNREELARTANAIREHHALEVVKRPSAEADEDEFPEGRELYRVHRERERSPRLVQMKKQQALVRDGALECEACGFRFREKYGQLGEGFIECHHATPVSELVPGAKTSLRELVLVCSNCHRMLHRRRPWLTVGQLRSLIVGEEAAGG